MSHFSEFGGFTAEERARISTVISDVDDTITNDGLLLPEALSALYRVRESGRSTLLVTGGSAGWADIYIRQWPVDAVITESGALMLLRDEGNIRYIENPVLGNDPTFRERRENVLRENEGTVLSSDQYCRLYDIAYDLKFLSPEQKDRLEESVARNGGRVLYSSIHANVVLGDYSKASSIENFYGIYRDHIGMGNVEFDDFVDRAISFGDGTNDEEMFHLIPYSVGNERVIRNKGNFRYLPSHCCNKPGGIAFASVLYDLTK